MHILLCKYYSKDDSRNAPKRLRKNCFQVWNNESREMWRKRSRTPQRRRKEEEEREYREEEEKDEEERMRQHGRGRSRARRQTVSYILVDACQGWIRHARGFYPRCLARDNIACDVEDVLWPDPDQRQDAGAESLFLLLFAVLYCTLQYIKLRNKTHGEYHKQHLLPVLNWIVLNLSHPCVRLCCGVCVFEGLCVMSESKVWFFSKIELFWVESFILTWI